MKRLLYLLQVLLLAACSSVESSSEKGRPATVQDLQDRFRVETPVSAERLENWLQDQLPERTEVRELHATTFIIDGIQRTEGEIVWTDQNGYVALVITDYASDSLSYLNLFRRYLKDSPIEPEKSLSWANHLNGFAWRWQEIGHPIHYLEAGLFDRIHLRLRSNFPVEESFVNQLAEENNWLKIFSPATASSE